MAPRFWRSVATLLALVNWSSASEPVADDLDSTEEQATYLEHADYPSSCASGNCDNHDACTFVKSCLNARPDGQFYGSAEYLVWKTRGVPIPALVTTAPNGIPRNRAGVLGDPDTRVAYGNQSILDDFRSGFRIGLGAWLNDTRSCGVEASFFYLCQLSEKANFSSDGQPSLFRPFQGPNGPANELVAFIDPVNGPVLAGNVGVSAKTEFFGFDFNGRFTCCCTPCERLDFYVGYRQLYLHDSVDISENLRATGAGAGAAAPLGTQIQVVDKFAAKSNFYGGQVGVRGELSEGRWFASAATFLAVGANQNEVNIAGFTTVISPGLAPVNANGGILALSTNSGKHSHTVFAFVNETKFNIGYDVTSHVRVFTGYSFLYWTNVARAGNQIDTTVNPAYIPFNTGATNPVRPVYSRRESDFLAHGWNLGVQVGW